ncbi:MAG: hypothetical protein QXH37_07275, partial [Candidatus Bathyarchaeia archaeon]
MPKLGHMLQTIGSNHQKCKFILQRKSVWKRKVMSEKKRIIFHLDMDHFFTAVEEREHPECRGKPVIVGADPK